MRWLCFVILLVFVQAGFAASSFVAGQSLRVFHPTHVRNWRGAKTEALIATVLVSDDHDQVHAKVAAMAVDFFDRNLR